MTAISLKHKKRIFIFYCSLYLPIFIDLKRVIFFIARFIYCFLRFKADINKKVSVTTKLIRNKYFHN
jgi:hypothetical protein